MSYVWVIELRSLPTAQRHHPCCRNKPVPITNPTNVPAIHLFTKFNPSLNFSLLLTTQSGALLFSTQPGALPSNLDFTVLNEASRITIYHTFIHDREPDNYLLPLYDNVDFIVCKHMLLGPADLLCLPPFAHVALSFCRHGYNFVQTLEGQDLASPWQHFALRFSGNLCFVTTLRSKSTVAMLTTLHRNTSSVLALYSSSSSAKLPPSPTLCLRPSVASFFCRSSLYKLHSVSHDIDEGPPKRRLLSPLHPNSEIRLYPALRYSFRLAHKMCSRLCLYNSTEPLIRAQPRLLLPALRLHPRFNPWLVTLALHVFVLADFEKCQIVSCSGPSHHNI